MKQVSTLAQLISESDLSRTRFEAVVLAQDPKNLEIPGVCGEWSIKDIMAHITAWENRMMEWMNQIFIDGISSDFIGPEINEETIDEYNAAIFASTKAMDLPKIRAAFMENHQRILDYIARLPEDRLFIPGNSSFEKEHPLWRVVAGNTFWHYDEHLSQLEKMPWFTRPKKNAKK